MTFAWIVTALFVAGLIYLFREKIRAFLLSEEAVLHSKFDAEVDKLKAEIKALESKVF